uniref:Ig-like domain-containing protein n=1 Tax=Gopherus evgoodei TaxID=1825980 RepID=A0A8C4YHV5_9SAUR
MSPTQMSVTLIVSRLEAGSRHPGVTPELLPRPSISLSPTGVTAPGEDITIRCQGQRRDVRFFLHKAGDLNPQRHMDPMWDSFGNEAEFPITSVGWGDGGSYTCQYHTTSQTLDWSESSDPVQLVVVGEGPDSTSLLPAPQPTGHSQGLRPQWNPQSQTLP